MNETLTGLADIVEPASPVAIEQSAAWIGIGAVVVVVAVVMALWVWYRSRDQRRVRAQLRRLQKSISAGELTQREFAYHLAAHLRDYFGKSRLDAKSVPMQAGAEQRDAWESLLNQLDALRYQPDRALDVSRLLAETQRWLR